VSRVQNLRKEADFEVTQRIAVTAECDAEVQAAVALFSDYVKSETLCERLAFAPVDDGLCDLNGHDVKVAVAKV
jgi:isoleucyl-tRNA synthetase